MNEIRAAIENEARKYPELKLLDFPDEIDKLEDYVSKGVGIACGLYKKGMSFEEFDEILDTLADMKEWKELFDNYSFSRNLDFFWFSFKVSYIYDNRLFLYNRLCAEELSKKNGKTGKAQRRGL